MLTVVENVKGCCDIISKLYSTVRKRYLINIWIVCMNKAPGADWALHFYHINQTVKGWENWIHNRYCWQAKSG